MESIDTGSKERLTSEHWKWIGTSMLMYTFDLYDLFTTLLVTPFTSELFFPSSVPVLSLVGKYASSGIAFVTRPFGAAHFGILGDRIGRRRAIIYGLLGLMVTATALAALPTYVMVGVPCAAGAESTGSWLTGYTFTGPQPYEQKYLVTDTVYNLTLTITVPQVPSGVQQFSVLLSPYAQPINSYTPFFRLDNNYPGITGQTTSQLYSREITFNAVPGQLVLNAVFLVPDSAVSSTFSYGGSTVTVTKPLAASIVGVTWGGVDEGDLTYTIVTRSVLQYMNLSTNLVAARIPQNYASVVGAVNASASQLASDGLYAQANSLLESALNASYPPPPSSTLTYAAFGAAAAGFVLAAAGFVLYLRSRSESEDRADAIKKALVELSGISASAGKYDRALAQKIEDLLRELRSREE